MKTRSHELGQGDVIGEILLKAEASKSDKSILVTGQVNGDTMALIQNTNLVQEKFMQHASAMPWVHTDTGKSGKASLQPGTGSCHTNGRCASAVLQDFLIQPHGSPTAEFLLFFDLHGNVPLHIDPSAIPVLRSALQARHVQNRLHPPSHLLKDTASARCHTLKPGDIAVFLGSRLHGVYNAEPSLSIGLHYPSKTFPGDEWVVYILLTGAKHVCIFDCDNRRQEAFISELKIPVTLDMCRSDTALNALQAQLDSLMTGNFQQAS
jgi:hypothetical protein